jgi:hypothetical protein
MWASNEQISEEYDILAYNTVWSRENLILQRNTSSFRIDPEDGGNMFL